MKDTNQTNLNVEKEHEEENLSGTLVSVFGVGVVILLMWFGAYGLYLAR